MAFLDSSWESGEGGILERIFDFRFLIFEYEKLSNCEGGNRKPVWVIRKNQSKVVTKHASFATSFDGKNVIIKGLRLYKKVGKDLPVPLLKKGGDFRSRDIGTA